MWKLSTGRQPQGGSILLTANEDRSRLIPLLLTAHRFWFGGLLEGGKAQGGLLLGRVMFQAIGVHGPELTPLAHAAANTVLVLGAFFLLMAGQRKDRFAIAALATLVLGIAALRVVFQPLPNVQPVTLAALLVGSHLGARRGMAFALLVTLLSNLLIGDGWWTLFQGIGWAAVAVMGSMVVFEEHGSLSMQRLCGVSVIAAFVFGVISTLSLVDGGTTLSGFAHVLLLGLPFDALHALGNLAFAIWLGPSLHNFLRETVTLDDLTQQVGDVHVVHG